CARAAGEGGGRRRAGEFARGAFGAFAPAGGGAGEILLPDEAVGGEPPDPGEEEAAPAAGMAPGLDVDEGRVRGGKLFRAAPPLEDGELVQRAPRELVEGPRPVPVGEVEARGVDVQPRARGRTRLD